jgi:hypothetical protein
MSCLDSPRFRSQVFSTSQRFPGTTRALRPCFMPQPFLGSSLQSFPLAGIAHPSRGHLLPCSCPPTCPSALSGILSPSVSPDAHAFTRLPGSPDDYGSSFSAEALPESPGFRLAEPLVSASFACFEALILLRIRSRQTRVAPSLRPMLSWVSAPLEPSPPSPWILGPAQAET